MFSPRRVAPGLALVPILSLWAAPALAQLAPVPVPPFEGEPEQACRSREFVGCLQEETTPQYGDAHLVSLKDCDAAPVLFLNDHYRSLDKECQDRCKPHYEALKRARDDQYKALKTYNDTARAFNALGVAAAGPGQPRWPTKYDDELPLQRTAAEAANEDARRRQGEYRACACECRGGGRGMSTGVKVGGAAGVALLGIGGAALFGGDGGTPASSNRPPTTNPGTPPGTSGSTPQSPDGTYGIGWTILDDIRNSAIRVLLQNTRLLRLSSGAAPASLSGGRSFAGSGTILGMVNVTVTGDEPLPTLMGTWDPATQQIAATGAGPLAGRPRVGVSLQGTLTPAGVLTATVTVGEDGSLGPPLPHIVRYGLVGNKRP